MISFSFKDENLKVIIKPNSFSKKISLILFTIVVVTFSLPLVFLVIGISNNVNVGFSFIFSLIIFWGTSWYFLKKFLWNNYGSELYILKNTELVYQYDYKLYRENFGESFIFNLDSLGFINDKGERSNIKDLKIIETGIYYFWLKGEDKYVDSTIPLKTIEEKNLIKELQVLLLNSFKNE